MSNPKPLDQVNRNWSKGNCFYITLQLMKDSEELKILGQLPKDADVILVHGHLDYENKKIQHAWILINGEVWDFSNGQTIICSSQKYLKDNKARAFRHFTRQEADALLASLPRVDGELPIGYWADVPENDIVDMMSKYDISKSVFADDSIDFSDPSDPANKDNLQI